MRDLALKVVTGGIASAFDVINAVTGIRVVPFACEYIGSVVNISATPTNAHSADILVNGAEILVGAVDLKLPATTTQGFFPPADRVFLAAGDSIQLRSNGENAAPDAYDVTFTHIFKPLSPRPAGEVWLDGDSLADIAGLVPSQRVCFPFACEVIGIAVRAEDATNAVVELIINIDNVDGATMPVPNASFGGYLPLSAKTYLPLGGQGRVDSDGGGTAGGAAAITFVLRPLTTDVPVGWVYLPFPGVLDFAVATSEPVDVVSPCDGKVRNLITHWKEPIDARNTWDLKVNAATPAGTPIYRIETDTRDEIGVSSPILAQHGAFVLAGDLITVECNGEQVAGTGNSTLGIWIEPMGGAAGVGP